ncbi:MAG: DNA polymerase III subunit epsilon, partial [Gammaproteobacteria bacterium]|nr:DNA polymerase III subunit epsilon [Gammaproteobacteria bacterium]
MRQIVLDTETTGLEASEHNIIEIGCVELVNRRLTGNNYHQYIRPDREVDAGAMEVHGISNEFLSDKPRFGEVMSDFLAYLEGAEELVIHNAPFDVGFLNRELERNRGPYQDLRQHYGILDTLLMARKMHPGQKNNLDALCKRYVINNEHRQLHGALLDAEILADVYLAMTGGQTLLSLGGSANSEGAQGGEIRRLSPDRRPLKVIPASESELAAHQAQLDVIEKKSG